MKHKYLYIVVLLALVLLAASNGNDTLTPEAAIRSYYDAIEAGDADKAAALFAEDAKVSVPSGRIFEGEAIKDEYIQYDLDLMEGIEFQTEFAESNGEISWSQNYSTVDGNVWEFQCKARVIDGKIVEWDLKN